MYLPNCPIGSWLKHKELVLWLVSASFKADHVSVARQLPRRVLRNPSESHNSASLKVRFLVLIVFILWLAVKNSIFNFVRRSVHYHSYRVLDRVCFASVSPTLVIPLVFHFVVFVNWHCFALFSFFIQHEWKCGSCFRTECNADLKHWYLINSVLKK